MNRYLKLDLDDVQFILGNCFRYFHAIVGGVYCNTCKSSYTPAFKEYRLKLDENNDILIDGICDHCDTPIRRCLETGEKDGPRTRAEATRFAKEMVPYLLGK